MPSTLILSSDPLRFFVLLHFARQPSTYLTAASFSFFVVVLVLDLVFVNTQQRETAMLYKYIVVIKTGLISIPQLCSFICNTKQNKINASACSVKFCNKEEQQKKNQMRQNTAEMFRNYKY